MLNQARSKMLKATAEKRTHYKLYKSGRNWTIAGLTVLFSGVLLTQRPQVIHAAENSVTGATETTKQSVTPSATTTLQGNSAEQNTASADTSSTAAPVQAAPTPAPAPAPAPATEATTVTATIGNVTKTYGGDADNPATVSVTLNDGAKAPVGWYYTGSNNTYLVNTKDQDLTLDADGMPGTSAITLSPAGLTALQAANPSATITADDVTAGQLTINKARVAERSITIADQSKTYDQDASTDPTTYHVTLPAGMTAPSTWTGDATNGYDLSVGSDITVADTSAQTTGDYVVNLSDQALAALQAENPGLDITAASVAAGQFSIVPGGVVTVATDVIDPSETNLPSTIKVAVNGGLKVPDDWVDKYESLNEIDYDVPLTTDNFDLSQVQLQTLGSYDVALSNLVITEIKNLNPDVVLSDDFFGTGKIKVAPAATTTTTYAPSWMVGVFDPTTIISGQAYNLTLDLYTRDDGINTLYDGLTSYIILPSGFKLAEATGSNAVSTTPAADIEAIIDNALEPSRASGFEGVTVTQLADYKGRQTFQVTMHTDGSNRDFDFSGMRTGTNKGMPGKTFDIPVVITPASDGTKTTINGEGSQIPPRGSEDAVVFITDDPSVTGGTYKLVLGGYMNVPSVAISVGVTAAYGLMVGSLGPDAGTTSEVINPDVIQPFTLVGPTGEIGTASYQGALNSTYNTADVVPNQVVKDGITYVLDKTQLSASDTLTPDTSQKVDTENMTVNAAMRTIVYQQVVTDESAIVLEGDSKLEDNNEANPATYTVQLNDGLVAPEDWQKGSAANEYTVAATSGDIDLTAISQNPGHYTVTLSDAGLSKLADVNSAYLFGRENVTTGELTINMGISVKYNYPEGTDTSALPIDRTVEMSPDLGEYTLGTAADSDNNVMIPMLDGYRATVTDENGKTYPVTADTAATITADGASHQYTVNYVQNATLTVQYLKFDNPAVAVATDLNPSIKVGEAFTADALPLANYVLVKTSINGTDSETVLSHVTGTAVDGANTVIFYYAPRGHYEITTPTPADQPVDTQTIDYPDDPDHPGLVQTPTTEVIAYVPGYTPETTDKALTPIDPSDLTKGYHIPDIQDPSQNTVITYTRNAIEMTLGTVTKTVHYVDQNGDEIAPDFTAHANFTKLIDPATGKESYGPTSATLGFQANPTIAGYTLVTSPAEATSEQTVQFGDQPLDYKVVYAKNPLVTNFDKVTKTVQYVDQDGKTLAKAFTDEANFTSVTDPVTGEKKYAPESETLGFQDNPTIPGYHVVTSPAGATSEQSVQFDDGDLNYTVVYEKNPLVTNFDKVTKTVQYVDQDGKTIAKAFTDEVNFTSTTDPVTGKQLYGPTSATLGFQANPVIAGYTLVTSPAEATSDQTVQFGDGDLNYTVVYSKNPLVTNFDKVTKTVQYVDENGKTLAKAFTDEADFTSTTDPATGKKSYGPESAMLGFQANPTIPGYTVVTSPAGATSEQTVQFDDGDLNYTVVYQKNPLVTNFDKVTKTVQYVDQDGKTIAKAFTDEANFTSTTDPVTGEKAYGPESETLGFQANPTIPGYHVVTSPAGATSEQTVQFDDGDLNYTVVYNKDTPTMTLDTVNKTIHYLDQDGNKLAPDYTDHVNFTEVIDPVTGDASYGPESGVLGYQTPPDIPGYFVYSYDPKAKTTETVNYGDPDVTWTVVYHKLDVTNKTITKTVHYVDEKGNPLTPDFIDQAKFTKVSNPITGEKTYDPETAQLGYQANPTIAGYTVLTSPAGATSDQTVQFDDDNLYYIVVYKKNPLVTNFDKVTKTVQYVDQDGKTLAKAFTDEANFTSTTDPATGEKKYGPESATLGFQDNPTIPGYTVVTSPAGATSSQTVKFDDGDLNYTVVYAKNPLVTNFDKVTKTVQYVDQDGKTLAKAFTDEANFTSTTDPVTGEKSYGPTSATLGFQDNPTIPGYHVVTSPAGATSSQTVQFDDGDLNYTVVYEKNPLVTNFDKVTKTVQYVDQDGKTLAKAFTDEANFTSTTDPVTGEKSYGPESATLGFQDNPKIAGYTVVTSPAGATSSQTVQFDDGDLNYTVVYEKNPLVTNFDKVTKTVQYVDQDGKTLAKAFTDEANFTSTTDPVTGKKSYGPESATLGFQANPTIPGYHVVTSPAGATSEQTVQFDDGDLNYTVVYEKNPLVTNYDKVTKTVQYVDQDGKTLAKAFTDEANFTSTTDPVTGEKSYGPESATLGFQDNPTIKGYHVVTSPAGATSSQTVQFDDGDLNYTVVYEKNPLVTNFDKVTKTVQYVDQDGKTLAKAFTDEANFTSTTDPVTGEKSYGPESATLGFQANPTIKGYHVVTNPAGATSEQTVHFDDGDLNYTVVYNKDEPKMTLDTVTKTVHYVDLAGNPLAEDFTTHVNFTKLTDVLTGEETFAPESGTLGYQANPEITGYHVVTSPAEATSAQTVNYGDDDQVYKVVYMRNMNVTIPIGGGETTPEGNGGTTTPEGNGGTTTPEGNGGTTTPEGNGGTTTPEGNGGTTTPEGNGGTTTPEGNGGTTTPEGNGGTTTPEGNGGTTTPEGNGGTTTPEGNGGTTTPEGNGGTTTPEGNGGTTTPEGNGGTTTPEGNGGTTTPEGNGGTTTPEGNGGTTTPEGNGGTTTPEGNGGTTTPTGNGSTTTSDRDTLPDTDAPTQSKPVATASTHNTATPIAKSDTNADTKSNALPQTGETSSVLWTMLGAGMIALLGLGEMRRKRH